MTLTYVARPDELSPANRLSPGQFRAVPAKMFRSHCHNRCLNQSPGIAIDPADRSKADRGADCSSI
jgi:hypothetical protein